jgi:glycosyltransferase involved in cell wall biosynthesis
MKQQPLVTIITPTYNHSRFIAECIKSAQDQTYTSWEMIVINDGSTDNTAQIVAEIAEADQRITLIDQENIGIFRLSETYNTGLNRSEGKYIAILEGDDIWEPTKLERQIAVMEDREDVILAWGSAYQTNVDRSEVLAKFPLDSDQQKHLYANRPLGSFLDIILYRNPITALTMLIRKDALIKIGGFQQGFDLPTIDVPTIQRLSTVGAFYFDSEILGRWRVYPGQTTKVHIAKIFEGFYQLALHNYKIFRANTSLTFSMTEAEICRYFDRIMVSAYSRAGRYKLIRGQYREARKDYIKSMIMPGGQYMWRIRSLIGLIFSFFHLNIETLASMLGRPSYKK